MNVLGLIVEYNPFHNGHLYHLQTSIKKTNADLVIAVMSGPFLQRGEPALVSKWARTTMALKAGIDLVVELPHVYATQKAEIFADGAVRTLDSLGVTHICFGSENGDITPFIEANTWLSNNETEVNIRIKEELKLGKSYPRSFSEVYTSLTQNKDMLDLSKPNNILGFHYTQSASRLASSIKMDTIQRISANYHDIFIKDKKIASATAIRHKLLIEKASFESISNYLPDYSLKELRLHEEINGKFHSWDDYYPYLKYKIITEDSLSLKDIFECEEGLEHRIKKCMINNDSFQGFLDALKTKRYTRTRLQRLLTHILLNTSKEFMSESLANKDLPYLRILGMSPAGQQYLAQIKKKLDIPIITNARQSKNEVFLHDVLASRVHELVLHPQGKTFRDEFTATPIQYNPDNY
ncbi:nucleotidyltransferase [Salipaludibacillus sp. CF4.18]|uniref:nucleotidyltransferase n=1 Tax=Salipaludibacillus sp. CF4.18 TaxID=3373081 RepID=UPI003EE74608